MPIYEYYCQKCDKIFETLIFGKETPACPDCGTEEVQRRLSACGFVSKGEGGQTVSASAGASACGGCTSTNCGTCGI